MSLLYSTSWTTLVKHTAWSDLSQQRNKHARSCYSNIADIKTYVPHSYALHTHEWIAELFMFMRIPHSDTLVAEMLIYTTQLWLLSGVNCLGCQIDIDTHTVLDISSTQLAM